MRKQIFFFSVGLILLALCSCDKSMQNETETNASMAKVKKRATTGVRSFELGNFVVNPALDDEFQLSEDEIVEELVYFGFLEENEAVDIIPIYHEDIIPAFFKSLIVEPESNEWYGINVDEVMNMYLEFPSIAFYIINSSQGKSFFTTADRRYSCNLVDYRFPDYIDPEIVTTQENIINELYDYGETMSKQEWDSTWRADYRRIVGLDISDDRFELKVCYWQLVCKDMNPTPAFGCTFIRSIGEPSLLSEDMRWGQSEIFGGCDHNQKIGSIVLSILKILYVSNYSGTLIDEYFESSMVYSNMDMLSYFAWKMYTFIEDIGLFPSLGGFIILGSCGFQMYETDEVQMQDVRSKIDAGKLVLGEDNGKWLLICGYKKKITTCFSAYIYDYDYNKCEPYTNSWYYGLKYKIYYY